MAGEVFVFKAIKPQRLKVGAFRLEILNALRKEGTVHRQKLKPTVSTWKNPPEFESLISTAPQGSLAVLTGPTGDEDAVLHWLWTDQGTEAHPITARNAPFLKFNQNFIPATSPGKFSSTQAASWGPMATKITVNHPGTKARGWTETLSKERKKPFERAIFGAMKKAASKAF